MLETAEIPVEQICLSEDFNCRGKIVPIDVRDLIDSFNTRIKNSERPLISPINVMRCVPKTWTSKFVYDIEYLIIAGHRRFKAHQVANIDSIICIIEPFMTEFDARAFNLRENTDRTDLNIVQEAVAIKQLMLAALPDIVTQKELAKMLNVSRGWVQIRVALLDLPIDVREEIKCRNIKQSDILTLVRIQTEYGKKSMYAAARQIKDNTLRGTHKQIDINRERTDICKVRSKAELMDMMPFILNNFGTSPTSMVLAWAAGELSTDALCLCVKDAVEDYVDYV